MTQKLETIIFRLAMVTGIIVAGLSFYHKFFFLVIILRGMISFLLIYLLGFGLIFLWQKASPEPDSPKKDDQKGESSIDFLVGEDPPSSNTTEQSNEQTMAHDAKLAGQINLESLNKLVDAQAQAEIVENIVRGDPK